MYPNVPQHYDTTVTFDNGDTVNFRADNHPKLNDSGQWWFRDTKGTMYIFRADSVRDIVARAVVMPALASQAN
jgi:hypothetical protein